MGRIAVILIVLACTICPHYQGGLSDAGNLLSLITIAATVVGRRYTIVETDERVRPDPEFVSRFRRRAEARARLLNAGRQVDTFRWAVVRERGRWAVVALQNVARPFVDPVVVSSKVGR